MTIEIATLRYAETPPRTATRSWRASDGRCHHHRAVAVAVGCRRARHLGDRHDPPRPRRQDGPRRRRQRAGDVVGRHLPHRHPARGAALLESAVAHRAAAAGGSARAVPLRHPLGVRPGAGALPRRAAARVHRALDHGHAPALRRQLDAAREPRVPRPRARHHGHRQPDRALGSRVGAARHRHRPPRDDAGAVPARRADHRARPTRPGSPPRSTRPARSTRCGTATSRTSRSRSRCSCSPSTA